MKRLNMFFKKYMFNFVLTFIIYLLCVFSIYPLTMFIEHNALINTANSNTKYNPNNIFYNNVASLVQEYFLNNEKVYLIINKSEYKENKETIEIIKARFKNIKICSPFFFKLHSLFFKNKNIVFLESEKLFNYVKKKNIKYVLVITSINKISDFNIKNKNIIKLSFDDKNKIILTDNIKEKIKIKVENIGIIDGDTIKYNNINYRLIGIDAPEITQNYGVMSKEFLEKLIYNAKNVYISVSDFDIYGRILAHLFIDNELASIYMIKEKLAIQTITLYGDSGFSHYAKNIINASVDTKKVDFVNPAKYRKTGVDKIVSSKVVTPKIKITKQEVKTFPLRLTPEILMSNKED